MIDLFETIKVGTRLTIRVPSGKGIDRATGKIIQEYAERSGKVVLIEPLHWLGPPTHWVLNMGGRYGTPGVADRSNIVAIGGKRIK